MKRLICFLAMVSIAATTIAQQHIEWRKDKVTQVIFPAEITKFRTGYTSDCALTQSDGQVLYIQPITDMAETNINVITKDGCFYTFSLIYNNEAPKVNYIVTRSMAIFSDTEQSSENTKTPEPTQATNSEIPSSTKQMTQKEFKAATIDQSPYTKVWRQENYIIANNIAKQQKLGVMLKAIYVDDAHIYFKFSLENSSNVPFDVDYIAFSITAKTTKKTSTQERIQIIPTAVDQEVRRVEAKSTCEVLYVFEKFTIGKDKLLLAEVLEQGGDRNIGLKISEKFIIDARKL